MEYPDIALNGNPWECPPAPVVDKGIGPMKKYYNELERADPVLIDSRKVVFIGHSGAGKTRCVEDWSRVSTTLVILLFESMKNCCSTYTPALKCEVAWPGPRALSHGPLLPQRAACHAWYWYIYGPNVLVISGSCPYNIIEPLLRGNYTRNIQNAQIDSKPKGEILFADLETEVKRKVFQ